MYDDRESLDEFERYDTEQSFSDTAELQAAAELLEITSDAELDQFIGKLIKRAGRSAGRFIRSDAGRALGGLLRTTAKKALPVLGGAIGGHFGGTRGTQLGSRIAIRAGRLFGLELEGMSPEDMEFETARRVVRLANRAAARLATLPSTTPPQRAAKTALATAARRHAPGLLRHPQPRNACCPHCGTRHG